MVFSNNEIPEKRPEPFRPETAWSLAPLLAGVGRDYPGLFNGGSYNSLGTNEGKGRRILVIDDDPSSLELCDLILQSFGYVTNLAGNGEEGLAKARSTGPDLILCDIRLPGLDGVEVMKRIKTDPFLRRIPIVALTIYSSGGHRERLLAAGFDGYLPKPTIPEVFIREISNILNPLR